jgi:hypothetical protein
MTDRLSLPQEIAEGLARMTAAASLPFGPPSFRSLAEAHITVFAELRSQGASWSQIGALLAERGIAGRDGQPIAEAVLRATVSAARRAAHTPAPEAGKRTEDTTRGERKRREALGQDAQRSEAQRHETRRSELQQHENLPQQNALHRRPLLALDEALLRRAESVQKSHIPEND